MCKCSPITCFYQECTDLYADESMCEMWIAPGHCLGSYRRWMEINCRFTCGFCLLNITSDGENPGDPPPLPGSTETRPDRLLSKPPSTAPREGDSASGGPDADTVETGESEEILTVTKHSPDITKAEEGDTEGDTESSMSSTAPDKHVTLPTKKDENEDDSSESTDSAGSRDSVSTVTMSPSTRQGLESTAGKDDIGEGSEEGFVTTTVSPKSHDSDEITESADGGERFLTVTTGGITKISEKPESEEESDEMGERGEVTLSVPVTRPTTTRPLSDKTTAKRTETLSALPGEVISTTDTSDKPSHLPTHVSTVSSTGGSDQDGSSFTLSPQSSLTPEPLISHRDKLTSVKGGATSPAQTVTLSDGNEDDVNATQITTKGEPEYSTSITKGVPVRESVSDAMVTTLSTQIVPITEEANVTIADIPLIPTTPTSPEESTDFQSPGTTVDLSVTTNVSEDSSTVPADVTPMLTRASLPSTDAGDYEETGL